MEIGEMRLETEKLRIDKHDAYQDPDPDPSLLLKAVEIGKAGAVGMLSSGGFSIDTARDLDRMAPSGG